jgi:hypothetical protein
MFGRGMPALNDSVRSHASPAAPARRLSNGPLTAAQRRRQQYREKSIRLAARGKERPLSGAEELFLEASDDYRDSTASGAEALFLQASRREGRRGSTTSVRSVSNLQSADSTDELDDDTFHRTVEGVRQARRPSTISSV